ncbi:hypothetical protein [Microcystis phage Mae-JY09]
MSMDTKIIAIPLGDPGGDKALKCFRAPLDSDGGGVTILSAYAVNHAATGAGTSFSLALHRYSAAGTPVVNGTVAAAIGGTASPWADGVPKSFALDDTYSFLDAGEWLAIDYAEQTAGNPTNGYVVLQYVLGR